MVKTEWQTIQYSDTDMSGFGMFPGIELLVIGCSLYLGSRKVNPRCRIILSILNQNLHSLNMMH
jgi:hypothetical protein